MEKILISACLLGQPVRYDGLSKPVVSEQLALWQTEGRLVPFCPEVAGGLPTPRPAAEIVQTGAGYKVLTSDGRDLTAPFVQGAEQALTLCQEHDIRLAIMTENSPSCGSHSIYDGQHRRQIIAGEGLTVALLRQHGIRVFSQHQITQAAACLQALSDLR